MSACLRELYALVTATSSALLRPDPYYQSMVEYALYYDVEPSLFYSLLIATLALLSLTMLVALAVLVRALRRPRDAEAGLQSSAASSGSGPISPLLSELHHSVSELQSRLAIADHARDAAQRRLSEREAAMEDERRRLKAAHRKALDDGAESKKDAERRVAGARKELDALRDEQRRAREERIRATEDAEARRHEDNKAKAKAKKDDKDERERRDKEEKRLLDLSASLQRQLDERSAQLTQAERKREEMQANMARLEDNISRYRAEVKERVEREEQLRAQLERSAQVVAVVAPERKKGEEERRWSEMDVVVRQLQHQNSSLMAELEQEKERKANHAQDADRESAAVKAAEDERARALQAKDDRIAELSARLTERDAELQRAQREVQALKERQEELTLECQHEEETASELKEDIAERDATIEDVTLQLRDLRTRLEAQLTAKERALLAKDEECAREQERVAELTARAADLELSCGTARQWQSDVQEEMAEQYRGKEKELKGRMRALLNWPLLPPSNPSRSPPPIAIPASSVPSSPLRRGTQPTMSVPSSPSAISLRADLEQYAQRLREAQLILGESPKAKAGRKEKARLVRKAREEVFDLMKKKKDAQDALEREELEDGNANRLPPVPLFTAAAVDESAEAEAENGRLRVQLEDFDTRFTEQTATVLRLRGELSDAQQRVAALLRTTVAATVHHAALASVAALQSRVTSEESKAQQLTEQLALGAIKVAELTLTTEKQAATIVDLSNRITASRTELLSARRQCAEKEKEAEQLSAQIAATAETVVTLTATSQSQSSTTTELNGRIAALRSELSSFEQSTVPLATHRALEADLTAQISSLEQQDAEHRAALRTAQSSLESERDRAAALSSQVDGLTVRLAQSTTGASEAGSTIVSLRAQVASLQSVESQLSSLSSSSSSEIARLQAEVVSHAARIAELRSANEELTSELAKRQIEVQSLQEERESLASLKRETTTRLESVERDLQTTETRRAALEAQIYGAIKQVHAKDVERRGVELQHQQDIARWEDKLLATQLSADTAVQAAEDEAERCSAAVADLQHRLDAANAQLQTAEAKATETDRLLRAVESQRDRAQKALKAVEETCAAFLEDLRLKESDIAELKERIELKETELADLRHLFEELKKDDARDDAEEDDLQRRDQEQHDHLNHSLIQLETAVQASAMRRGNTLEHSAIAVMMREHTPVKPRRFVFINNDQQPTSPRARSATKSPRNVAALLSTPVVLSPSTAASALSARSSDAAAQIASLQSTVASLRHELKEKEDALAEETKKVEAHQATIERFRQQAKGARDGGLTALHRLQASQSRMEELNRTLSAKMAAIHNRKTSAPVADGELRLGDVDHSRHASTPTLPTDAALSSAEVSTLLAQLQSEHTLVREQAAQLSMLRQQQQVEAAFHASVVQRLEASEERRLRLKRQVRRQQEAWEVEKAKIEALIEMSTAELEELEEQREEREGRIADLEAQLHTWKDKAEQLTAKIDDWAQQEHETSHRETKKEYLKRRWHELTYGGHRHCASCERAAANGGPASAHGHGQKTPVKKAGDKEKRSRSPSSSSLQIPSPHKRSHSDSASHAQGGAEEHRHHHGHAHDHDGDVTEDDGHDLLDAEAVVAGWKSWKATVDKLQRDSEHDEQTKLDLQSLAEHLTRLTSSTQHVHGALREKELEKLEMSLVLPSFDLTSTSAITVGSGGSDAPHNTKDAREAERRLLQAAREREEAMAACARVERELHEERVLMKNMEAELVLVRGELAERRKDEAQVHTVLQQARSHVALHSRKPSSATSVQSFHSATSSAYYSDEQKELEERDGVVDPFLYPEAALKAAERRFLDALAEIDSLTQLRREDEAKIEEAIRQLRLSREQVCTDYADMLSLSQQLTVQQRDLDDLRTQLLAKDALIAQLQEQLREAKEAGGVSGVLTASMVEGELGEVEARLREMTEAIREKDVMLRGLQTQVKELRDFIGMQEGTIRKLEKQRTVSQHRLDQLSRPQPSTAHQPPPSSAADAQPQQQQDALIALSQLGKDFRAEQRLRVELQRAHQLPVVSPIASPSHSRAGSGAGAAQDSPRGAMTPQRMAGAGLSELAWWQQRARRNRGGSSSSTTSPFSSPATGVLSALSGAFTNDGGAAAAGSRTSTPSRSRPASVESATDPVSTPTHSPPR